MWGGETRFDCFTSFFSSPRTKYLMKFNTFSTSYGCIRILEYFKTWTSLHLLWLCLSPSIACFLREQDILRKCNVMKIYFLWMVDFTFPLAMTCVIQEELHFLLKLITISIQKQASNQHNISLYSSFEFSRKCET